MLITLTLNNLNNLYIWRYRIMLPNFLNGQEISAFDKNNKIVEGKIILTSRGTKVCLTENCAKVPISTLSSIRSVGKNLKEEVESSIKALSDKIDWKAAAKAPDKDKVVQAFVDTVASSSDDANKEDVKKAAEDEAKVQLMQTNVANGTSTASTELEKYMKDKENKVQEAEAAVKENILKEDKNTTSIPLDYGENNVYPVVDPNKNTGVVDNDSSVNKDIENDVDADIKEYDDTKMQPMTTDMEVAQGIPITNTDSNADSDTDNTDIKDALNYIDDGLKDSEDENEDLDSLKDRLTSVYEMPPEDANKLVSNVKDNVESTVANIVKDTLSSVIKDPVTDDDVENKEQNTEAVSSDAIENSEEDDDVDREVEKAIDDYESNDNYSDEGMYESLCTRFNIDNGQQLLMESNNCIPDAVLLLAEQIRSQRLTEALVNKVANEVFNKLFASLSEKDFDSTKTPTIKQSDVNATINFLASSDFTKFINGNFADKLIGRNNVQFLREITENFYKLIKKYFNDKFSGSDNIDTSKEYGVEIFIEANKSSLNIVRNYLLKVLEKFEDNYQTYSSKPTVRSFSAMYV